MLYCYLSDSSLLPDSTSNLPNNTDYNQLTSHGKGVGQITERVLSIFNIDDKSTEDIDESPGVIIDPRANRLKGLFQDENNSAAQIILNDYRCAGKMHLYYDKYWAIKDNLPGDNIYTINFSENPTELETLFNVIEKCIYSHVFNSAGPVWDYRSRTELEEILHEYSSSTLSDFGYYAGSLEISNVISERDKKAKVKFISGNDFSKIITNNCDATGGEMTDYCSVLFPSIISFGFVFKELQSSRYSDEKVVTNFTIYFDPETLLTQYKKSRITNIIFPTDPRKLLAMDYDNVYDVLRDSSNYVGNILTTEVTKSISATSALESLSYTGASAITTPYKLNETESVNLTYTFIYKGRVPTEEEMKSALSKFLEDYIGDDVDYDIDDVFPELETTASFIIVPIYDTRQVINLSSNNIICENIVSLKYIDRIVDAVSSDKQCTTIITIPSYNMYAIACPIPLETDTHEDSVATKPSVHGLDSVAEFQTYQAIDTDSEYWITMSDAAQTLNSYLSKIVAAELNNHVPYEITYTIETKELGTRSYAFYVFTVGGVSFSVMKYQSYRELLGV